MKKHVQHFLSNPFLQTGLPPPVKIVADKATHKHWSRNLSGVITIIPGAPQLIQGIFLAATKCAGSSGDNIAEDIYNNNFKEYTLVASQYTGCAYDGAFHNVHVGEKLDKLMHVEEPRQHDVAFLHRAGRVEINMRESPLFQNRFKWMNEFIFTVSKANKLINYGQDWEMFYRTVEAMIKDGYDIRLRASRMMSDTRFPNHIVEVFECLRENWPGRNTR